MKKSHRILLLALATLLFLLPALVACSSDNTEIFYCNTDIDDFGFLSIEEAPKGQANYRGERTYDKDGVLVSCLIREKYTNHFVYELTYNPDGTIASVLYDNGNTDEYKYNENGLCIAINTTCYEYDEEGKCVKSYDTSPEKNYLAYTYNENGQLCEITRYKLSKTGEYNESLIESRYYDQNGNIIEKYTDLAVFVYEYRNGKHFKTTKTPTDHPSNGSKSQEIYELDENGNLINFLGYRPRYPYKVNFTGNRHYTEYQYDDRGNLIKELVYETQEETGERKLIEEFVTEYDNNDNPTSFTFFSDESLMYKVQYTFTKDDVCKKSVVTHADGNVIFEYKGYVVVEGSKYHYYYHIDSYNTLGQVTNYVQFDSESGAIIESEEYEYDENGIESKITTTFDFGYVQVHEKSGDYLYDPEGKLFLAVKTQPIDSDISHFTVYNSENQVVFECDAKFNRYINPGGLMMRQRDNAVEYCIGTVDGEYVYFRYENGTLRVETE